MEDCKARKLREKLGISTEDQQQAAGKVISPNLQRKISGFAGAGGNFVSAPPRAGGNFVSAPPRIGGNFVSSPPVVDRTAVGS